MARRRRLRRALRRAAGLGALALAAAACDAAAPRRVETPPDSAAGEVGFDLAGRQGAALVVPVYVDGAGPFDFVLDTGATFTCVEQTLVEQLELRERRGVGGVGVGVGGAGRVGIVTLDSLRIGTARAYDLPACVLDLQQMRALGVEIHGLVGLNFLRNFRVTLDFEREVVRLEAP